MAYTLSRIDRKSRTYDLSATVLAEAAAIPPDLTGVDVALLPPRGAPTASTVWYSADYADGSFTVLLAGPDADSTGALVVPASADIWMRIADSPEVDAEKLERIIVLGGGTPLLPATGMPVVSVNGKTGTAVVLSASDVGAQSSATLGADVVASATVKAAFVPALNILSAGVSVANTGAANRTALAAVVATAKATGAPLYLPPNPLGLPAKITGAAIDITGVCIRGEGRWSRIQQTTGPNGIFSINGTDTVIDGLDLTSGDTRVSGTPGNNTYSAILLAPGSNRTTVRNISGGGFDSMVNIPTETTTMTEDLVVDNVQGADVAFVVAGRALRDASIRNIRCDSYNWSYNGGPPPHVVYIASIPGTVPLSENVHISNVEAADGQIGAAVKLSGLRGGSLVGVYGRNCRGLVECDNVSNVQVRTLLSLDDANLGVAPGPVLASISLKDCTNVSVRGGKVAFANIDHGMGLQVWGTSVRCHVADVEIEANRATASSAQSEAVCRIYGTDTTIENVTVNSIGADVGTAFLLQSTNARIINPRVLGNVGRGVFPSTGASGTTVIYDPAMVAVKTSISQAGVIFYDGTSTEKPRLLTSTGTRGAMEAPVAHVALAARGPSDNAALPYWHSGHAVTNGTSQAWIWDANGITNSSGNSNGWSVVDSGTANAEVEVALVWVEGKGGITFRHIDTSNFLTVDLQSTGVVIQIVDSGAALAVLATSAAMTIKVGRKYRIKVAFFSDQITVYLDDISVLTHTLSAPNLTKFGAATKHGLHSVSASNNRFRWARINGLT